MQRIPLRADGSEIVQYNAPDFPVRTGFSCLSVFAGYAADCHWHQDFEFLIALDAPMEYQVNGKQVVLRPGEAIFVNSRRLHFGYSAARRECRYCYAVFHPQLLGMTPAVASALELLCADGSKDDLVLSPERPRERAAIDRIRFICDHGGVENALSLQAACAGLLADIQALISPAPSTAADPEWTAVRAMVGYIQARYREKLRLEEIAAAGAVCRSRCCALFREKLHTTPMGYVTRHRLDKACGLMREGRSVTEAAFASGFQGLSFFSETFRKIYGIQPSAYLRQLRRTSEEKR